MFNKMFTPLTSICLLRFLYIKIVTTERAAEIKNKRNVTPSSSGCNHSVETFHKSAAQVEIPETKPAKNKYILCFLCIILSKSATKLTIFFIFSFKIYL